MRLLTLDILVQFVKKYICFALLLFVSSLGWAQNTLEKQSFEALGNFLDNHKNTDTLYFDYLKAYENKAQKNDDLEKIFYAKSKYIVHGANFNERLRHAQELLKLSIKKQDVKYMGLAYNKLALVYYKERDMEQSLHYELLAEKQLSKTNDLYNLNKSRYGIATIYYFVGDYEKALSFFSQTANYYKNQNSYNDLRGYISSVKFEIKNHIALQQFDAATQLINFLDNEEKKLKTHHLELENGYLFLLNGQNLFAQKQYKASLEKVQKALPVIKNNEDFANEHLAYLYIGKNLWQLNEKEEAVEQFRKVDYLYDEKEYSDLNLLEAYDYLIAYYKTTNNLKMQLFYTEKLLTVSNHLQKQYKGLSNVLHTKYETTKLEASRDYLQKELKIQMYRKYVILGIATVVIVFLVSCLFYYKKKQKTLRQKYELFTQQRLFSELGTTHIVMPEIKQFEKENKQKELAVYNRGKTSKKSLSDKITEELLQKLNVFEDKQEYLNPKTTINSLAKDLNTNSKYLSEVINNCKGQNFTNYLNQLRINLVLTELDDNKKLRKLTISAIAEEFGFNNARSFSDAFFKVTGLKPSYYISQLEKDDKAAS
ncbi:helix-turn-helix domain-containing protein [Paenimyroides marinum]|nr:helix-turn-helix domain-containing protein [Paenimyroides aquimaris]